MANFRKSFNLRNGVQVDDDNFIVNANGLVGIGTSVPTEFLDVRGNTKVVGVVTANSIFTPSANVTGVATITQLNVGVVTSASGLTTYYGDGRFLQGLPTSQWIDTDVGLGYTSIYAAGNVGVATTDPRYSFQVGGNPDSNNGVGFNSTGSVKVSGIVTATTFSGNLIGNVTGNITGDLTGSINSSGVSTFTTLLVGTTIVATSGVVTATTFNGNLSGNVTGNLTGNATGLSGTPNINVGVTTATTVVAGFSTIGVSTVTTALHVGTSGTAFSALNGGRIGVGTAIPTSEIQVRKSNGTLVEVISDTSTARISIGQSVGVGKSTAVLRFGDTNKTFDILNNDTGNINMYLHAGPSGINTGRFAWVYGQSNAELASLTYDGKFGIGVTNPTSNLHVVGTSTITGNANFGSNVTVVGILSAGTFSLPPLVSNTNIFNSSGISTFNNLNVTGDITVSGVGSIGIATTTPIAGLDARSDDGLFSRVGINTTIFGTELLNVNGSARFSSIGIGTSSPTTGIGLVLVNEFEQYNSTSTLFDSILYVRGNSGVGVGTTSVRAALDFADAGKTNPGLLPGEGTGSRAYMLPPRLTNAQRVGLATAEGAFIFNTDTKKFQGYTGVGWTDFH